MNTPQHLNVTSEEIDTLSALESVENEGRGINCVRDVISNLKRNNTIGARSIREWDGDKTRGYHRVENQLIKMFGCRMHGVDNCQVSVCALSLKWTLEGIASLDKQN